MKNVSAEENEDGNFFVVSTSPSPLPQQDPKLNEKLSKVEQQLQLLTTKVDDFFEKQNGKIKTHFEKQITLFDDVLKNNTKQFVQLLEEKKGKEKQRDKTLSDLSKNLEDSFKSQLEEMEQKMSKVERQVNFLTTKVNDSFGEQIKKLLQKQTVIDNALKNNSKQIVQLIEGKQVQQDKTLAVLSKKLEGYSSTVDSFKIQLEQIYSKLELNQRLLNKILEKQEKTQPPLKDCNEVQHEKGNVSGVYWIQPAIAPKPFLVWCDMETKGGGWVYVLNRFDASLNFSRNWTDYKEGFGNPHRELWLGLEHLYELTSSEPNELLIEVSNAKGVKEYAIYSNFEIGNEDEGYKLRKLGMYSGNAENVMETAYGQKFSTLDNDQDASFMNCANLNEGGWWYKTCDDSLTAFYVGHPLIYNDVIHKTAKMMIKPIK